MNKRLSFLFDTAYIKITGIVCLFGLPITFFGGLNEDEGWYPYVGNLLYEGNNLYSDVMFTQTPISAYVYGFVYHFINSSILTGRLTAFLIYLIAALIMYSALARLFNSKAALLGSLIAILCPILVVGIGAPITYPIAIFFIALSLLVYSCDFKHKYILIGVLIGLACMTRLTAILAILFFIFLQQKRLIPLLVGCLVGILPFFYIFMQNPQATIFDLFTYHTAWMVMDASYWASLKLNYIIAMTVALFPLLLLYALNGFRHARAALAAILAVAAIQWLPIQTLHSYNVFMLPIIGYAAAANIAHLQPNKTMEYLVRIPLCLTAILMIGIYVGAYQPHQLRDARDMASYLQEITEPGEQVFTYHTYIAIEAGLTVDKRQAMSSFSYWRDGTISEEDAILINAITSSTEREMLGQSPRILILDSWDASRMENILSNYEIVRHYDRFGQFQIPFDVWLLKESGNND